MENLFWHSAEETKQESFAVRNKQKYRGPWRGDSLADMATKKTIQLADKILKTVSEFIN